MRPQSVADDPQRVSRIATDVDVLAARYLLKERAEGLGFVGKDVAELMIVICELASNILKYAGRGSVVIESVDDQRYGVGVRIAACDSGPSFHDLSMALKDGHGDRGPIAPERLHGRKGIGSGLGAVVRFTDSFECDQQATGKRITVVRYRRRPRRSKRAPAH